MPHRLSNPERLEKGESIKQPSESPAEVGSKSEAGAGASSTPFHTRTTSLPSFLRALERAQDVVMITEAEPIHEPDGPRIVYVNPAFERLTGYSCEEAIGRSPRFLQGPKTDPAARARITSALEKWQPIREELLNYRKDGGEFWVELSIDPIADEKGRYTHWVSVQRDTTARNMLREELAARERDLRDAQRIARIGQWTFDTSTGVVTWSPQTYENFGIDPSQPPLAYEEMLMRNSSESRKRHRAAVERCVTDGTPYELDIELVQPDGSTKWALARGEVETFEDGKPRRLRGTIQDITERKMAERDLHEAQRIAKLGHWTWNILTQTMTWSEQNLINWGLRPDQPALSLDEVLARETLASRERHLAAIRTASNDGTPYELDLEVIDPDGSQRWLLARGEGTAFMDGVPSMLRGTVQNITSRKRLEEEARQTRDKLGWILDTITDGLLMVDLDWRFTYINEQGSRVLGADTATFLGRRVWEVFDSAELPVFWRECQKSRETVKPVHFEEFYPQPLNLWLECHCYPSPDGLSVYFRDVTERKRMEEEIRVANERFELALKGTPIILSCQDLELRYTWIYNPALGYRQSEVIGRTDLELFKDFGGGEELTRLKHEVIATGRSRRQVVEIPTPEAGRFYDLLVEPKLDGKGLIEGVRCAAVDISERKKNEAAQQASDELVHLGVKVASLGLANIDYDTGINHLSAEAARMFGLGDGAISLPRAKVHAAFHKDDRPELERRIANCLDPKGPGWFDMDHRVVWPNGDVHWLRVRKQVYFKGEGSERRPDRAVLAAFDITASKNVEQALLRSEKLASVGRLASTIAHEINNPLEIIGQTLYLALTEEELPESVRPYLQTAVQELDRVALISRQTLAFNRETSSARLTDLADLAAGVVRLFASRLASRGIVVEERYRGKTEVMVFAGEIRQIFSNLLANSLDAVLRGGRICVRVHGGTDPKTNRSAVRIIVADSGSGIAESQLGKIFEAFFTTKEIVGTGLGLWVTRQLVDKHNGTLRVRSKVGTGTVFVASFPST